MNKLYFILPCLFCLLPGLWSQIDFDVNEVASGFNKPLDMKYTDDGQLFIVEKDGIIKRLRDTDFSDVQVFLDIKDIVSTNANERGLLGLALAPDFEDTGYFFVNYTNNQGNTIVARYQLSSSDPSIADPESALEIIEINQPYSNHNGGCIAFGPDGYLYVGMGDGGAADDPNNYAQNPNSLLGKMLRLDVSQANSATPYLIPPDNPFADSSDGVLDEIWALGLRNPWRFSFDRLNGDLWIGDVGQNEWEEINFIPANTNDGLNFGWRCYEGNESYITGGCSNIEDYDFPVLTYNNNNVTGCSVTGGYRYRGCKYPDLFGAYIYMDYCSGRIWAATEDGMGGFDSEEILNGANFDIASFGEDRNGNIYLIGLASGKIFRIEQTGPQVNVYNLSSDDIACQDEDNSGALTFEVEDPDFWNTSSFSWSTGSSETFLIENLEAGTYSLEALGNNGCSIYLEETITNVNFEVPEIQFEDSLFVEDIYSLYQWLFNGEVIQGANSSYFTPLENGTYSLLVTNAEDCTLETSSFEVDILSSTKEEIEGMNTLVRLFPNPIQGDLLYMELVNFHEGFSKDLQFRIVDTNARILNTGVVQEEVTLIPVDNLPSGVYYIHVYSSDQQWIQKLVK